MTKKAEDIMLQGEKMRQILKQIKMVSTAYQGVVTRIIQAMTQSDERRAKFFRKIEVELNNFNTKRKKSIGRSASDPCQILSSIPCEQCTGYYKLKDFKSRANKRYKKYRMANKSDPGAIHCQCKEYVKEKVRKRPKSFIVNHIYKLHQNINEGSGLFDGVQDT